MNYPFAKFPVVVSPAAKEVQKKVYRNARTSFVRFDMYFGPSQIQVEAFADLQEELDALVPHKLEDPSGNCVGFLKKGISCSVTGSHKQKDILNNFKTLVSS